jgi:large subunit ribosomal protein L30
MILIIRISGDVEIREDVKETMFRMRLRRKYSAVLMQDNEVTQNLLAKTKNFVAYGTISKEMLSELLSKRSQKIAGKKADVAGAIANIEKKSLEEFGIKPFFRLHPPRGGIDSKIHFGTKKGVLGDNKEKINDLLRKML